MTAIYSSDYSSCHLPPRWSFQLSISWCVSLAWAINGCQPGTDLHLGLYTVHITSDHDLYFTSGRSSNWPNSLWITQSDSIHAMFCQFTWLMIGVNQESPNKWQKLCKQANQKENNYHHDLHQGIPSPLWSQSPIQISQQTHNVSATSRGMYIRGNCKQLAHLLTSNNHSPASPTFTRFSKRKLYTADITTFLSTVTAIIKYCSNSPFCQTISWCRVSTSAPWCLSPLSGDPHVFHKADW